MGNNRGTDQSNVNKRDGSWSERDRWDFSWAEFGQYDQPAFIDKILSVTGKPKLTYIGFSGGTSQMLYGLGKMHDSYFADRLERVVLVAPCIYVESTYEGIVAEYLPLYENGIYKFGG